MAKPPIVEGATATNPTTGARIVYRAGKWYPAENTAQQGDTPAAPMTPGSDSRARIVIGLGPAVTAERHLSELESTGHNAFTEHPLTNTLVHTGDDKEHNILGMDLSGIGRVTASQNWQDYDQAVRSFEAAVLPVLSGAAVTPSEAQRQIRASLPQYGDFAETLRRKALNRQMMLNGAADLAGHPRPYPAVGTMGTPPPPGGPPAGLKASMGLTGSTQAGSVAVAAPAPAATPAAAQRYTYDAQGNLVPH